MRIPGISLLIGLFVAVITTLTATAGTNVWSVHGPVGGRVLDVSVDHNDPDNVYVSTVRDLYRLNSSQTTWDIIANISGVASIQFSQLDPDVVVVETLGTTQRSYLSSDGGSVFTGLYFDVAASEAIGRVVLASDDRLFGTPAFSGGLATSDDLGITWSSINQGIPLATGSTTPMSVRALAAALSDANRVYAMLNDYRVIRTEDGGQNWIVPANLNLPLSPPNVAAELFVDPLNPNNVIVQGRVAYQSLDGGETWNQIASVSSIKNTSTVIGDSSTLYAITNGSDVSRSISSGVTWINETPPPRQSSDVAILADGSGLVGTTGGVYTRQSETDPWAFSSDGLIGSSIVRFSQNSVTQRLYVGTEYAGIAYTDDGALTFESAGSPSPQLPDQSTGYVYGLSVSQSGQPIIYGANGSDPTLYQSQDEGDAWSATGFNGVSTGVIRAIEISPLDSDVLYVGSGTNVYRSDDAGLNWTDISPPTLSSNVQSVKVHQQNDNIVVVSSQFGGVYHSSDAGVNWTQPLPSGELVSSQSLHFSSNNADRVYVIYDSDVWLSQDTGATWNILPVPGFIGSFFSFKEHPADENILYAQANNLNFGRSVNGGLSWESANEVLPLVGRGTRYFAQFMHIDTAEPNRVYAADTGEGVGVYTFARDVGVTGPLEHDEMDIGTTANYTFTVANGAEGVAGRVTFTLESQGPVTLLSAEPANSCTLASGVVSCSFLQLGSLESIQVNLEFVADSPGSAQLDVVAQSTETELNPDDNSLTIVLNIVDPDDLDLDGVPNVSDNCTNVANASQFDVDADGYGNACDADFDQSCTVNFLDIVQFSNAFLTNSPVHDLNDDGAVNFIDFSIMAGYFLLAPGPSGTSSVCDS